MFIRYIIHPLHRLSVVTYRADNKIQNDINRFEVHYEKLTNKLLYIHNHPLVFNHSLFTAYRMIQRCCDSGFRPHCFSGSPLVVLDAPSRHAPLAWLQIR